MSCKGRIRKVKAPRCGALFCWFGLSFKSELIDLSSDGLTGAFVEKAAGWSWAEGDGVVEEGLWGESVAVDDESYIFEEDILAT